METCGWDGYKCELPALVKGFCRKHYTAMYQRARRAAERLPERLCEVCGTPFTPRAANSVYCSTRCKNRRRTSAVTAALAAGELPPASPGNIICEACGAEAPAQRIKGGKAKRFCSHRCNLMAYHYAQYGLTVAEALKMKEGGCAICGKTPPVTGRANLHIDHDHVTGRVRGALCHSCNVSLGHFGHDPAMLRKAAAYLE